MSVTFHREVNTQSVLAFMAMSLVVITTVYPLLDPSTVYHEAVVDVSRVTSIEPFSVVRDRICLHSLTNSDE